jgi:predicted transcriptional regulator
MDKTELTGNKDLTLNLESTDKVCDIMKAFASKTRINILRLLSESCYNVNEIAEKLDVPMSTVSYSINLLENAGIINTKLLSGKRGSMKVCSLRVDSIHMNLSRPISRPHESFFTISMPIGNFVDCKVAPTCGMVSELGYIDVEDKTNNFFNPQRTMAQLIWLCRGFLTYKFPNSVIRNMNILSLEFSLELCSEVSNYRNIWPSDITFWINQREIGTWTSPGDLGGRKGKLNPPWWPETNTQFGLLKKIGVTKYGSFIDETKASDTNIDQLALNDFDYIKFKIGIKEDAKNQGGLNLFGERFGDYPQNIVMTVYYTV